MQQCIIQQCLLLMAAAVHEVVIDCSLRQVRSFMAGRLYGWFYVRYDSTVGTERIRLHQLHSLKMSNNSAFLRGVST